MKIRVTPDTLDEKKRKKKKEKVAVRRTLATTRSSLVIKVGRPLSIWCTCEVP